MLWGSLDRTGGSEFVVAIEALVAELPERDPIGIFECASAQDATGHPELAVPLYRAALAGGLEGTRRRRATIQLASSLRVLGKPQEAIGLLMAELDAQSDELDGAVRAFLALALVDVGREREAVALSLVALTRYLPRYNKALARYAAAIEITKAQ